MATVDGSETTFEVRELPAPNGDGRSTPLSAWGAVGLIQADAGDRAAQDLHPIRHYPVNGRLGVRTVERFFQVAINQPI